MKSKIWSLILVLMLLPMASIFSACKKEDNSDLSLLDDTFYNIASENNNIKIVDDKLLFDFSSHEKMANLVDTTAPYSELQKYVEVYNNLMTFTFSYIDNCSINSKAITKDVKDQIESDVHEFSKAIKNVNEKFNMLSEIVIVSENDTLNNACVGRFENLLNSYQTLFQTAINLNSSLNDLYFNKIVNNSNPDVYSVGEVKLNPGDVISKLESRVKSQISCLTESFVEMYIDENLSNAIANQTLTMDLIFKEYKTNIDNIVIYQDINEEELIEQANTNKKAFYNLAVKAQNIQSTQNNNRGKFIVACNAIEYTTIKNNSNATAYQKMCVSIIEENEKMLKEYNDVLLAMIKIGT